MDTYIEFCIHFWEATRELDLYSMDGSQLNRLIVDALLKTNGGKELIKTSMNELSVLIRAINHNNKKIQQPSLPPGLDEAAHSYSESDEPLYSPGHRFHWDGDSLFGKQIETAFKAGAQWRDAQIPKLPDSIDEAAQEVEDYYDVGEERGYLYCHRGDIKDAFKAGAEWMAGQGTTVRKKIGKIDDGVNQIPTYSNGFEVTELDVPFLNSKECGYGNEVIVQIRKK